MIYGLTNKNIIFKNDKWDVSLDVLSQHPDLNCSDAGRRSVGALAGRAVSSIYNAITGGWTMMLGYSSGKDSEVLLHLFLIALIRAVRHGKMTSRNHFILHTDTGVENPEVSWLARKKLAALEQFIDAENLPLTVVIARPGMTSSWTGRILTGRGLPTFTNSSARQCSHELKIDPARRAKSAFIAARGIKSPVCLMLGSRDAESQIRAGNIARKKGNADRVIKGRDGGELYPIKNWLASDVWEYLLSSGSEPQYPLPSYLGSNTETAEMYRAATGECVWTGADKKSSGACGARFGCWSCQAVGLDKSMQNLLTTDPERFGYMKYLGRIQSYLAKRRYAWEDRHPVGRTIYGPGYIKIQPDVYSPAFLERLLHVCCSADYVEQLRADDVYEKLIAGELEHNEYNLRMAEPQFRIVSEAALVHIDFMWGFHHFNGTPHRAMEIYHKVWSEGQLDLLGDEPSMLAVPRTPIPAPAWVKVGRWGDGTLFSGLADPVAEMVYFEGGEDGRASRIIRTAEGDKRVVAFCQESELTVDDDSAAFIVWNEYDRLLERARSGICTPGSAAQYYLRFGVVQISAGKAAMYDRMMQRGQTLHRRGLSGQQSMASILTRRDIRVISQDRFHRILGRTLQVQIIRLRWWSALYLVLYAAGTGTPERDLISLPADHVA
jgi:3'-phosphoadenosine 5'-phosphosulfate sulfotransferase (PAPS reductase)/FAD synthetase